MCKRLPAFSVATLLSISSIATAQIIDDFEVDTSAGYTIVDDSNGASGDGTPDSNATFAFDYIGAGIPLAPNSMAGDRGGLRLAVNETADDEGAADHITAFNNLALTGNYRMQVDVYLGVESAGGTTEMAHVGVGGSTNDFLSIFTPIVDNGYFMEMTGDGGSSSDYRMSAPGEPAISDGDSRYLNDLNTTNATGDTYQNLYPATDFPGSPGNSWTTLAITVGPNVVFYELDGVRVMRTPNVGSTDGLIGLGYTDPFSSVGPHFVIYDNLTVSAIPEPTTGLLACLGLGGVVALAKRRRK